MDRRTFLQSFSAALAAGTVSGTPLAAAGENWKAEFAAALARKPWLLGYKTAAPNGYAQRDMEVEGKLPEALRGTLYRNGPARHEIGDTRYQHWFDGDGMIHAFRFEEGRVSHRGKFVQTAKYLEEEKAGRALYQGFGTASGDMPPLSNADQINVANINVIEHAGELLALWEGGSAYRLDPETLETLGLKSWSRPTTGLPFSAHPRLDTDGTLWNFGYAPSGNALVIYRIDPDGALRDTGIIPRGKVPMVHDFMVTKTHLVLILPPFLFDVEKTGSFLDHFAWQPEQGGRALIIDKNDLSSVQEIELPPFWVFHFSNAFETGGVIEFNAPTYGDPGIMTTGFRDIMRGDHVPRANIRFLTGRLDLQAGTFTTSETSEGSGGEFPRIDDRFQGERHGFTILMRNINQPGRPTMDSVWRIDHDSGDHRGHTYSSEELADEHVFVPNPQSASQGEGWVIGTSLDTGRKRSTINIFDAQHIEDGPIARAHTQYPIPLGLHGNFVPAS